MKKYAIILLVLIAVGVGLAIQLSTQDKRLDQTVFQQTTESIRHLQTLEQNFQISLAQSRLNARFDATELSDLSYQISEEFDNLRYDALFEEIENDQALSRAIIKFETEFADRDEALVEFIDNHQTTLSTLGEHRDLSQRLLANASLMAAPSIGMALSHNQNTLLNLALGVIPIDQVELQPLNTQTLVDDGNLSDVRALVDNHSEQTRQVGEQLTLTQASYLTLAKTDIKERLDDIEGQYVNYHNQAIDGSTSVRNGLIGYGLVLLLALLFFAWQIRRNYVSLEQQVAARTDEIKTAYDDLRESQEQLIQSEKMASLGQMVAGIAHEINTPLGYVSSNIESLKLNLDDFSDVMQRLESLTMSVQGPTRDNREITQRLKATIAAYKSSDVPELLNENKQLMNDGLYGLSEISKLVRGLKDFAQLDRQQVEEVDLNDCIESSLTIASNSIRENNVQVDKKCLSLPTIACNPSKLNQLFLNIITNACQAMQETGGVLSIKSSVINNDICIQFTDHGVGMDQATQQKMFDPFFTTKPIGQGTGLGLSVAYKILEAHKARVDVRSKPGKGTTISLLFPISQAPTSPSKK